MIIEGLDASGLMKGRVMALDISRNWLRSNFVAYQQVGKMIEKYDATSCGKIGGGGEYNPQVPIPFPRTHCQACIDDHTAQSNV